MWQEGDRLLIEALEHVTPDDVHSGAQGNDPGVAKCASDSDPGGQA